MSYTLPWTVNKFVSTNINNADSITGGTFGNVSFKVGGKTQLVGNTVIEGKLGVGGAVSSNAVEVNGTVSSTSLTTTNLTTASRNLLSSVKFVTAATSLVFGDPEYICLGGSTTYIVNLPTAVTAGIGTKFSFFFRAIEGGIKTLQAQGTQKIFDGDIAPQSALDMSNTTDYMIELVCIATSGTCWVLSNRALNLGIVPYLASDNTFTGDTNTFQAISATSLTTTGGITATTSQTIDFGTNTPIMDGSNITGVVRTISNQSVAGLKTFTDNLTVSGATTALTIPRLSTTAVNTAIGSTMSVGSTLQNVKYDTTYRNLEIWEDQGTGPMITWDTSNNAIEASPNTINLFPATSMDISTTTTFTDFTTTFNKCPVTFKNTSLGDDQIAMYANTSAITINQLKYLSPLTNGIVDLSGNQTIYGVKTFNRPPVMYGNSIQSRSIPDGALSLSIPLKNGNNYWGGLNTFDVNLPTTTQTPTLSTQLVPRSYIDSSFATVPTLSGTNTFTGATNTFNNAIRALSIIPTNRPALSTNRYIGATNEVINWEDPQNIIFNGNGTWTTYLPTVTSGTIARVGSRFTFGFTSPWTGTKTVQAQTGEYIYDGGTTVTSINVSLTSATQHYMELLCVNYAANAVCWAVVNRAYRYSIPATMTFSAGITASAAQTINFGTNAPTMAGTNVSGVVKTTGTETIAGLKTFSDNLTVSGATNTLTIPRLSTAAVNANIGSTINVGSVLQNFTMGSGVYSRFLGICPDSAATVNDAMIVFDLSGSGIAMNPKNINLYPTTSLDISTTTNYTNYTTTFNRCPVTFKDTTSGDTSVAMYANTTAITINQLKYLSPLTNGIVDLSGNQTIFGVKSFNSPPVMSGASITSGTIPIAALDSPVPLLGANNTYTGINNFTGGVLTAPTTTQNSNTSDVATTEYIYRIIRVVEGASRNVSIGFNANASNNGANNFALGHGALASAQSSSSDNVAIGVNAGNNITTGYYNFALGGGAMQQAITNTHSVAIGYSTLSNGTNVTGTIAIGSQSLGVCNGNENCGIGWFCAGSLSSGIQNCMYGSQTGSYLTTGSQNTFLGAYSGGVISTGSLNTLIGYGTTSTGDYSNSTALGYNASVTGNNQIILGTSAQTTYPMGGLNIPAATTMTLLGNLVANGLTITPTIMGYIQGLTSSAQTQLTNLSTSITNILDGTSAFTGTVGFVNATFSGTATFNGILTTKGQYLKSCAPIQTTSFTITSSLIYENYPINISATSTVTLPAASAALLGVMIRFRRIAGGAVALNSASSNIYPATSFTAGSVLLTASNTVSAGNSVQIVCLQLSATPTYGWFHTA